MLWLVSIDRPLHNKTAASLVAFALLAQNVGFARQASPVTHHQTQITWNELGILVVGQQISTVLPDGTRLQGEALAVRPESLLLDVHKSSKKKLHGVGQSEIPRTAIGEIRVIRPQGAAMRVLGGVLGAAGGALSSTAFAVAADSTAAFVVGLAVLTPLAAVGGYYAGKMADRRVTRLGILPDSPAEPVRGEQQ